MTYGPKADSIIPGDDVFPTSNLSLSVLQIDWPAPQDKKRECVAKGKNNQVTRVLADMPWQCCVVVVFLRQ